MRVSRKKISDGQMNIIYALIILLIINYMFGTIILKDMFLFKYLRDILLALLLGSLFVQKKVRLKIDTGNRWVFVGMLMFLSGFLIGCIQSESISIVITVARRYIFPLLLLYAVSRMDIAKHFGSFLRFIMIFFTILCFWGVFQAQVLGDTFLRNLGYPLVYSYYYERDMLYNSFYFGGFGIQRVVATLSSSNIFALVSGASFFFLFICKDYIKKVKHPVICLIIIMAGYLLSFSRSNFLAMFFVVILVVWPYVPYKKQIFYAILFCVLILLGIIIYQGEGGIFFKILGWVRDSFHFKDSSAAGRFGIWQAAMEQIAKSPLGIGLGHVGGMADVVGISELTFSAENSYFTIALDTGWLGLLGYLVFLLSLVFALRKKARRFRRLSNRVGEKICTCGYALIIYLMIVMLFSNHIQDMEVVSLVYIYAGIGLSLNYNQEVDCSN